MYKRRDVEKYHNIHQGIHQRNRGKEIVSIQCQLDNKGEYHDKMLDDGSIIYIGEGGLSEPQQEVIVKKKSNGAIHRMYGNRALINASKSMQPFNVINKYSNGSYEYLGKWIVLEYEYSPWMGKPAHFRFHLKCTELPNEFRYKYAEKLLFSKELLSNYEIPRKTYHNGIRIIQDNGTVRELKKVYNYKCTLCNSCLAGINDPIVEVHHLIPLETPHFGEDSTENMIVLCPNHRSQFDAGVLAILPSYKVLDINGETVCKKMRVLHSLNSQSINYHNNNIFKGNRANHVQH
jgi:putative restriction endonuclease